MADGFEFSLLGVDQLVAKLEAMTDETKYKGGRFALSKAAQLVAIAAAEEWRKIDDEKTGRSIADNIVLRGATPSGRKSTKFKGVRWSSKLFNATGNLGFRVGVQGTARPEKRKELPDGTKEPVDKSKGAPTPHWRLLEFGTSKIAAKGIMRRALTDNINAATNTFIKEYEKAIDRAIKKAAKGK